MSFIFARVPNAAFNPFTHVVRGIRFNPIAPEIIKPEEIFKNGFKNRGNNKLVSEHIKGRGDSYYVSWSNTEFTAKGFAAPYGVYTVANFPEIMIDIMNVGTIAEQVVMTKEGELEEYSAQEGERAQVGPGLGQDILFARYTAGLPKAVAFGFGKYNFNKDYKPRNFSVEILSADPKEQEMYAKAFNMPGWVVISEEQAKEIVKELKKTMKGLDVTENSHVLIINRLPEGMSFEKSMDMIKKIYTDYTQTSKYRNEFPALRITEGALLHERGKIELPSNYPALPESPKLKR